MNQPLFMLLLFQHLLLCRFSSFVHGPFAVKHGLLSDHQFMFSYLKHPLVIVAFSYHGIIPAVWPDLKLAPVNSRLVCCGWLILPVDQVHCKKEKAQ
jgi:hypothetical protein